MSSGKERINSVRILPETLSDKIAAGEVAERPASVVKELIENSLDAQSTKIVVEIEQGGQSLIRVSDNGFGMSRDDALLSVERYATSKIIREEDLFAIKTLGFRGEALPSIAAVSRFCLETRDEASESGTRIMIQGGKLKDVSDIGAPVGTQVSVSRLFFNTPARRKFLKSIATETGHIADMIANIALSRPGVSFKFSHNGKMIHHWASTSDPKKRVSDVLGAEIGESLHEIRSEDNGISLSGWLASPRISRGTSAGIYMYVNGRFVKDRAVLHALTAGYSERLMKGRFPVAVIRIMLDPGMVDVNVHPAKTEVRFAKPQHIHEAVRRAVSDVLRDAERPKSLIKPVEEIRTFSISEKMPEFEIQPLPAEQIKHQETLWKSGGFFDSLRIIGQIHGTYILCESRNGLIVIDQHAAHERVVFEQLKKKSDFHQQHLLSPEPIELSYEQRRIIESLMPELKDAGIEIESFGKNTFVITAIPTFLSDNDLKTMLTDIADKMSDTGLLPDTDAAKDECLMLVACHSAIRANRNLSQAEIKSLLSQMDQCDNPSHCPHGRPTWIEWDTRFLEKAFGRMI